MKNHAGRTTQAANIFVLNPMPKKIMEISRSRKESFRQERNRNRAEKRTVVSRTVSGIFKRSTAIPIGRIAITKAAIKAARPEIAFFMSCQVRKTFTVPSTACGNKMAAVFKPKSHAEAA